jgi:hypothetical protein
VARARIAQRACKILRLSSNNAQAHIFGYDHEWNFIFQLRLVAGARHMRRPRRWKRFTAHPVGILMFLRFRAMASREIIDSKRWSPLLRGNLDAILAPRAVCRITARIDTERCWSGRTGLPAKQLSWQNRDRGFESPPLRHYQFGLNSAHNINLTSR